MTTNNTPKSDNQFSEAPASWNTRYITPEGFECQLTLRGEMGQEVLERAQGAIVFLLKHGCAPSLGTNSVKTAVPTQNIPAVVGAVVSSGNHNGNGSNGNHHQTPAPAPAPEDSHKDDPAWCPIHQCEMKRWEKDGRVWYSHNADGVWCSGKTKKNK